MSASGRFTTWVQGAAIPLALVLGAFWVWDASGPLDAQTSQADRSSFEGAAP